MMDKSAALFRASNLILMDYCFGESLESALSICDEAVVVVDVNSKDGTLALVHSLAGKYGDRVLILEHEWQWDRMWQERVWDWGMEATGAEWLMYADADEVIDPEDAPGLRALMSLECVKLINFPYLHFYGTPAWRVIKGFGARNTRLGRRSHGFRMRNWCSDEHPHWAACQVVWGPDERSANDPDDIEGLEQVDIPIWHYGWVRNSIALSISQTKHYAWYADGAGYEDGHIPDVKPYRFDWQQLFGEEKLARFDSQHPVLMRNWFAAHAEEWHRLDEQADLFCG